MTDRAELAKRARACFDAIVSFGWQIRWPGHDQIPDDAWPIDIIRRHMEQAAALSAGEGGAWSLPKFFREEEPSFGFEADTESMSPEQAAITLMRRLRREVNELPNPQPRKDGKAAPDWELIAAEAYQVIGALADRCGLFGTPEVHRALDRVRGAPIEGELLPWSAPETLLGKCFECGGELSVWCPHCNAPDVPAGAKTNWKLIDQAPYLGEPFLAAVEVQNSRTGASHFDYAILYMDEGRLHFHDDQSDTGWSVNDYTLCLSFQPPNPQPRKDGEVT